MSKKCCRFFGGLLDTQEKWLNKMSGMGYRLVRTGKMPYEFEGAGQMNFSTVSTS